MDKKHLKQAFIEFIMVVITIAFSVGYTPPKKLKDIMKSPEFLAFTVFGVLFLQLGNDVFRSSVWALSFFLVDRHLRESEAAAAE